LDNRITATASQEKCASSIQGGSGCIVCCSGSGYSPQLAKEPWDICPGAPKRLKKPRKNSLAGYLLENIKAWVQSTIEEKYGDVIGVSGDVIMNLQMQIAIANGLGGGKNARKSRSNILATKKAFYGKKALSAWAKQLEDPAAAWEQDERLLLKRSLYDAACSWKCWDAKAYVDEVQQQQSIEDERFGSQTFTQNAAQVADQSRHRIRDLLEEASVGSTHTRIQEALARARREFDVATSAATELERIDDMERTKPTRRQRGRPRKEGGRNQIRESSTVC
jgi:hypothetical protein